MVQFSFLPTDLLLFLCVFFSAFSIIRSCRRRLVREAYRHLLKKPLAIIALMVLSVFLLIGLADSVHFHRPNVNREGYSSQLTSLLDTLMLPHSEHYEKTYSAPFSSHLFVKEINQQGRQFYPKLVFANVSHLTEAAVQHDIVKRVFQAIVVAVPLTGLLLFASYLFWRMGRRQSVALRQFLSYIPRYIICTAYVLIAILLAVKLLSANYHLFGTGKIGQDIFYYSIKSIRTGLIIGLLTTLFMLPFALALGIGAGFFGGKVDDFIQYTYITLSSIPGILLIAASVLSMQVFIANHPALFSTLAERADLRLLCLCLILGVTSWTGLCRMLRAETLKLREIDYIQAAMAMGSSSLRIIRLHILPNVMHIVIISVVLDFSFLVLAEAVLAYIGVGVSPTTISWGNMINGARLELAREPVVWWPLASAFIMMFGLVLSVNVFADALRDVFDPRYEN